MAELKRFWKQASAAELDGGWGVLLDGRPVRTPAGQRQLVPGRALAEAMAEEWDSQGERVDIAGMHLTRLANVAIDRTPLTRADMEAEVAHYCETDLVCFLDPGQTILRTRQNELWRPLRDWAGQALSIMLLPVEGVIASPQPQASLDAARAHAEALDDFRLTGLVYGCALFGSAVLALAAEQGRLDALEAFALSRLEEDVQIEQWGEDAEAAAVANARRLEAAALGAWFETLGEGR